VLKTPTLPADAGANASVWDVLLSRLVDVFRIHRIDTAAVKPLLSGDERLFMEQQLRLALEQAQLGALRRQQSVYDTSLGNVKHWLEAEFEPDAPGLAGLLARIGELAAVRLETPLPDVSGSLRAFQDAVRAMP
jgi:uroporphyrin-3 C-methyltransferase